ncbi:anthranilate phosphoribosyltransferase [Staphylococcus lutrae]|uniref:Anthranilate phosphoribosyltransferase n=1 Tax=Staphylococcus lutrae TaxID=155085 RepID=A0AAC9RQT9_9STAP|nr:anthranilate phosphoribosyltransferase [Staphylococcus lutrae]ARJ50593.1 anthranilate phosphoribosyltransferase [Staphylococcus lutrae]PNZ37521.1 anthranilate phosphoribosyltransferase [Staphylococcus lutrae]
MTLLNKIMNFETLNHSEMSQFVGTLLSETTPLEDKVALLVAYTMKGETTDELYALCESLIHTMYTEQPRYPGSMCVCGTGGDGSNSFNISTTVSFVAASGGIEVVKHGNKSVTSRSGGMDLLQVMGIATTPVQQVMAQLKATHLAFVSATESYPVMKHMQPVRVKVGRPTILNLVGPIINPFALDYQAMGVFDASKMLEIAEVLYRLGRKRAIVMHGANGMDEATLSGDNRIVEMDQTQGIREYTVNAIDYGLRYAPDTALRGGTPEENKAITLNILNGSDRTVRRDVVLLNAGLAFYTAEVTATIEEGIAHAVNCIDSGAAYRQYEQARGVAV